jgi:protein O-GlcNAc transferase
MDHQRFAQTLPALYHDWGTPHVRPRDERFAELLSSVGGMTTPSVLQLLNHAVAHLAADESYAEVGCFRGSTLVGALTGQSAFALAADNFSEFDPDGTNRAALAANLRRSGLESRVRFYEEDCERFLLGRAGDPDARVGVYFYDGAHDYRSQLMGLLLAVPLLARRALVVVDDANWPEVRQGTRDFLAARPEARLLLDLPTPGNRHPSFWNGLLVLAWDAAGRSRAGYEDLQGLSQPRLLASLSALQGLNLEVRGQEVRVSRVW